MKKVPMMIMMVTFAIGVLGCRLVEKQACKGKKGKRLTFTAFTKANSYGTERKDIRKAEANFISPPRTYNGHDWNTP